MKCPSCNKFAAFDTSAEPEVDIEYETRRHWNDLNYPPDESKGYDPDYVHVDVTGTARIVLTSECCGDEMKESNFDICDFEIEVNRAAGCKCDLMNALKYAESSELTDHSDTFTEHVAKRGPNKGQTVRRPIPPRFQRRYYGASIEVTVSCACGKTTATGEWADNCPASGMDELV